VILEQGALYDHVDRRLETYGIHWLSEDTVSGKPGFAKVRDGLQN
jgi:hypothetical protein